MKKIVSVLYILLLFIFLINIVYSEPLPWGIAINDKTKECAGYWGGDEFVNYKLPSGWKDYYPTEEGIVTPYGKCGSSREEAEKCCKELGLTFVSNNIGKGVMVRGVGWSLSQISDFPFQFIIIFVSFLAVLILGLTILKVKTKSLVPFFKTYTKKGLFVGAISGFLFFLAYYVYVRSYGFGVCLVYFTNPILTCWITILVLTIIAGMVVGFIAGLIIQMIKHKTI